MKSYPYLLIRILIMLSLIFSAFGILSINPPTVSANPIQDATGPRPNEQIYNHFLKQEENPDGNLGTLQIDTPVVTTGKPGLSYRYLHTYGQTQSFYFDDAAHLNYPYGLGIDGANVWVADSNGERAMKYDNQGNLVQQIGKAGFRYGTGRSFESLSDVVVDHSGNIWLADRSVSVVYKFAADGSYLKTLGQAYSQGSDNTRFRGNYGLAVDSSNNIYVADGGNHRVQIFSNDGTYLATLGQTGVSGTGNNQFNEPRHLNIDNNSRLYVADYWNHRIQIFDVSNLAAITYISTIGVSAEAGTDNNHFKNPAGVTVDSTRIFVADERNNRIQVFDRITRAFLTTIGSGWGQTNNNFWRPSDVGVDSDGILYIVDSLNSRVQVFDSNLLYLRTLGVTGVPYLTNNSHFNRPSGVAIGPDGSIYLTEERGMRLIKLDPQGNPLWVVGEAGNRVAEADNAHLNYPTDIVIDSQGLVYVSDSNNSRIQIYRQDGSYAGTWDTFNSGADQFLSPKGMFIDSQGKFYVADADNNRVLIFDQNRNYLGALGVKGERGSDNAHFAWPIDIAVDAQGTIFVSDNENHRIQVFDLNLTYLRTMGHPGQTGDNYGFMNGPSFLAIDKDGNLYEADQWDHKVQVFDPNGAFLTVIGEKRGAGKGDLANPHGLAFDQQGNLYIADYDGARLQVFARGVPGWDEISVRGFGDYSNFVFNPLYEYQGRLMSSVYSWQYGAQLFQREDDNTWTQVMSGTFGTTPYFNRFITYNGWLYAGLGNWGNDGASLGGSVWRSPDGGVSWNPVSPIGGFPVYDGDLYTLVEFGGYLFAGTGTDESIGGEIWRCQACDGSDWIKVVDNGFGDPYNNIILSMLPYGGYLYAGTRHAEWSNNGHPDGPLGGEVWRTSNGTSWEKVNDPGFGDVNFHRVEDLIEFQGALYAALSTAPFNPNSGGQIWRCVGDCASQNNWSKVADNGFGDARNQYLVQLYPFAGLLFASTRNMETGLQLWSSADGVTWSKFLLDDGFGSENYQSNFNHQLISHNGRMVMGVLGYNAVTSGSIWQCISLLEQTATPTSTLTLTYTNSLKPEVSSSIQIPTGAVTQTVDLAYTEVSSNTQNVPVGFLFAGRQFTFQALQSGVPLQNFTFQVPVTITLGYSQGDLARILPDGLELRYWNGASWTNEGITVLSRDHLAHKVVFSVQHLSGFALFGPMGKIFYLPLVLRK